MDQFAIGNLMEISNREYGFVIGNLTEISNGNDLRRRRKFSHFVIVRCVFSLLKHRFLVPLYSQIDQNFRPPAGAYFP